MPVSDWSPYSEHVQKATDPSANLKPGQFFNNQFLLICAGPPFLEALGGAGAVSAAGEGGLDMLAYPIGIVQNWGLAQNRQVAQLFEIGSQRTYFIVGRHGQSFNMSRVYYHGPSLLRVLYAYYADVLPPTLIDPLLGGRGDNTLMQTLIDANILPQHNVKIPPGYENVFLNLASDMFSMPFGLMLIFMDNNEDPLTAIYLEQAYITNHSINGDANGLISGEGVGVLFERLVPVQMAGVSLMGTITGS